MEATEKRVKFSGPESSVEMEVMKGFNGKAVKVSKLPSAVFQDYTQFRSVPHTHSSAAALCGATRAPTALPRRGRPQSK